MQGPTDARMYPPESEREDALVRRSEIIISSVLRGGVILSATVIAIGVAAYYLAGASAVRYPHGLRFPDSIPTLWLGLTHGDPLAIIALGLIFLLITPVLRVAVSVLAFAAARDLLYVAITLLVLLILISSFLLGLGGG